MRNIFTLFTVLLLGCTASLWSQTATGTIVGTVSDNSGAVVAGAKVEVTNTGTNAKREVTTNAEGGYTAPLLPPGSYRISVATPGFKTVEQTGIVLQIQQQARVDITLQVGAVSESIAVTGDA